MPIFVQHGVGLVALGPRLRLELESLPDATVEASTDDFEPQRPWIEALIDTGATVSVIKAELARRLRLHPTGVVSVGTPSEPDVPCVEYSACLRFDASTALEASLVALPLDHLDVDLLLGRDVLAQGLFVYQGHDESFTLAL